MRGLVGLWKTCAMFEWILALALALPQASADKAASLPHERMARPVALAVSRVATTREEALFLLWQAWKESRLSRLTVEHRCQHEDPPDDCDAGLAAGPWQVHPWCGRAHDESLTQAERLEAGAACSLRLYRSGLRRCGTLEGAFAAQSTTRCQTPWARKRARDFTRWQSQSRRPDR